MTTERDGVTQQQAEPRAEPAGVPRAMATEIVDYWLDLRPLIELSDRDRMELEGTIAAALEQHGDKLVAATARAEAAEGVLKQIAALDPWVLQQGAVEIAEAALRTTTPAAPAGIVPGSRELDALEALGDLASWFVDFVDERDRKRWPSLVRAHEVLGWPLPAPATEGTEEGAG